MTEQWQLTMEDRRAEDEEEMARWKWHKMEGAANRKRAEQGKKVPMNSRWKAYQKGLLLFPLC